MNLQKIQINIPKCEEDIDQLFIKLKELQIMKDKLAEANKAIKEQETTINLFIESFFKEKLEDDPKYKIKVENGSVIKRNQKKWVYGDEESIINQLKTVAPELIRTKLEIDKVKLKKVAMVDTDGEIIIGKNFTIIDNIKVNEEESISISITTESNKDNIVEVE